MSSNKTSLPPSKEQACSAPIQEIWLGLTVFLIFVMIITFIGNLLVLLAVIFFRRLRSMTNYFIVSLAVSDLFIALLSLPFRIHQNRHNGNWCLSLEACQTWLVIDGICTFASIWNLTIISIDRFIAIRRPFQYHSLITTKVGLGMISSVWTYSLFLSLMMLVNWTKKDAPHFAIEIECANEDPVYFTVVLSLSFFLPLMIVLVMYGLVFEVALNQTRAMAALQVDLGREQNGQRRRSINMIREVKAAKTLAVVVGCFIICWLPFDIILMISTWQVELIATLSQDVLVGISLTFIYVLPALNSTMNPIIYALMNREFRSAFVKLVRRMTGNRLGDMGGRARLGSTTASRSCSMLNDPNIGPLNGVRFSDRESDSSTHQLPTMPPNNDKLKPIDNHVTPDTHSMETSLDDDRKAKVDHAILSDENSGQKNDNSQHENDVIQLEDDVIQIKENAGQRDNSVNHLDSEVIGNECVQSDNDNIHNDIDVVQRDDDVIQPDEDVIKGNNHVTKYDDDVIENPMATTVPLLSSPSSTAKALPPIESDKLNIDSNYKSPSASPKATKTLKVSPSPDVVRKNNENSIEHILNGDNTAL